MYKISSVIKNQELNKLQVQKLVEAGSFEILSISLEKDAVFPKHSSPTNAQLIVLEGDIVFHIEGVPYELSKYQSFSFPKKIEHWVKARKNSKFLIIR